MSAAELRQLASTIAANNTLLAELRDNPNKYTITDPQTGETRNLRGRDIDNLQNQTDQLRQGLDAGLVDLNALREAERASRVVKTKAPSVFVQPGARTSDPDVGTAIDTSHLDTLEIEQQREVLARSDPRIGTLPSLTTLASRGRRELGQQAQDIEATVIEQDRIFNQNIAAASKTLTAIKDAAPGEKVISVETEDGTKELTKSEYQTFIRDYTARYNEWRVEATGAAVSLRGAKEEAFGQISQWAQNVRDRNEAIGEQKRDFNTALQNVTASATERAGEPGLTKFEERFGVAGIPGPAAGPAPGSFGQQIQQTIGIPLTVATKETLNFLETPFVSATEAVRTRAERLQKEGIEAKSFKGLGRFLEGAALVTSAAAFDAATFGLRPGLALKSAVGVGKLVGDPETRKAVVSKAVSDPFTFTAEIAGSISGAALGAKLSEFGRTGAGPFLKTVRAELNAPLGKPSEGLFGTVTPPPRASFREILSRARTVAGRQTVPGSEFNALLADEISLFSFPEEVVPAEAFETFIPESVDMADTTFNIKFGKLGEELIEEATTLQGDFGITPTRGSIKTPFSRTFGRTGADLRLIVPDKFVVPTTIFRFKRTPLTIPSGAPAIPISIPQLGVSVGPSFAGILSAFNVPKTKQIQRLKTTQIQRPQTVTQQLQKINQRTSLQTRNIMAPPQLLQKQTSIQQQIQPQIQRVQPIQLQKQLQLPIQIPTFEPPGQGPPRPTPFFFRPPPPRSPSTKLVLDFDPRKKKKKPKKKRGKKQITQKRKSPLGVINWDPRKGIR
jgi:hypothetical protein